MEHLPSALFVTTCASFLFAEGLVLTAPHHARYSMDAPGALQKVHARPTPRIGGLGIYVALLVASALVANTDSRIIILTLLIAGAPALIMGLLEDVTKKVTPASRLLATLASGATACWMTGTALTRVDVAGLDALLAIPAVGVAFTAFAVAGVSNAINIIDGYNGLASGTTCIALCALATIAETAGDIPLTAVAMLLAAAVAGFWLVNFPWGKLFLGDGGAYFAGFALSWLAVLLPIRNPSISPWASLLVCGYPVIEVIYSVARRFVDGKSPGQPDCGHLHSLMAKQVIKRHLRNFDPTLQNSAVSILMWLCAAIPAAFAATHPFRTPSLALGALACVLLYHWLYRYVVRL